MPEVVVRELWTYPVKGCQGVAQDEVAVTRLGIPGDRGFTIWRDGALRASAMSSTSSQRWSRMPDPSSHHWMSMPR